MKSGTAGKINLLISILMLPQWKWPSVSWLPIHYSIPIRPHPTRPTTWRPICLAIPPTIHILTFSITLKKAHPCLEGLASAKAFPTWTMARLHIPAIFTPTTKANHLAKAQIYSKTTTFPPPSSPFLTTNRHQQQFLRKLNRMQQISSLTTTPNLSFRKPNRILYPIKYFLSRILYHLQPPTNPNRKPKSKQSTFLLNKRKLNTIFSRRN